MCLYFPGKVWIVSSGCAMNGRGGQRRSRTATILGLALPLRRIANSDTRWVWSLSRSAFAWDPEGRVQCTRFCAGQVHVRWYDLEQPQGKYLVNRHASVLGVGSTTLVCTKRGIEVKSDGLQRYCLGIVTSSSSSARP